MMEDEEVDLVLSLGVGGASESQRLPRLPLPHLNLMPFPLAPTSLTPLPAAHPRVLAAGNQWCNLFASSSSEGLRNLGKGPCLRGIDVTRETAAGLGEPADEEEEDGVSSPNSTVSSAVSGGGAGNNKGGESGQPNSSVGDESELERTFSRVISDEEDGGEGSRSKKLRLSKEQAAVLEESFKEHHTLNPRQKLALAKQLNLRPRQVEVWFQNRRARTKLKQTEVDCELLRRCCEGLTEENRRLQKEVQELRALKLLSPQHYMHMAPPTTLILCPSCERVASAANPNPPAVSASPLAAAGGHDHLLHFPQQRLHQHIFSLRHLLPAHRRPVPVASAGHSLPWAPASLRATAFIDAPPSR